MKPLNFLLLLCMISFFLPSCQDKGEQVSELCYKYDYASHTAMVIHTPNNYPDDYPSYFQIHVGYSDYSGNIVIPSSVTYKGESFTVTSIGYGAFAGCERLLSISIPSTVISIEKMAIIKCPNLEKIYIDKNNPTYDSRYNCNAVIETATNTLLYGSNKTTIPGDVSIIGPYSFIGLSFETIYIEEGVEKIDHHTFQELPNLKSITLPNSITYIGEDALASCSALREVTFGTGLKTIFAAVLAGDRSLESITCLATTPPNWAYQNVKGIIQNIILYVPDQSVDLYAEDPAWGTCLDIRPLSSKK